MSLVKNLKARIGKASRSHKLSRFFSHYAGETSVLDVGVSGESKVGGPTRNYFLKNFPFESKYYTGLGVQDLSGMDSLFPGKRFVRYEGGRFPFSDQEFGWVFSNAVIEHVGGPAQQLEFINEMLRVGKDVFFTTPNKYFPFETHTNAILLHWNEALFHWWCDRTGRGRRRQNLRLLSYRGLRRLMNVSNAPNYVIKRDRFMGFTMTLTVICKSHAEQAGVATGTKPSRLN